MAENVKVIVRCRPLNKKETANNYKSVIRIENPAIEIWDPGEGPSFTKTFTFDSTYDQNSSTETIYNDICYPLVESVLEGYNATVFVYGQTGCGKSFTMEGIKGPNNNFNQKGIISRAFEHIFEATAVTSGVKYLALVSYLEIYNEQIRDLLVPNDKMGTNHTLNLKETPTEGVAVSGLTVHPVHNSKECDHFLNIGSKNRMIGATLMNQNSSRSHSIFTISIEQLSNINNNESIKKGKLNLVDLAGSERQAKTGATGNRLKEATKINLSLSALGNVISALVDGKAKHIPYRDSKLTRLLQDSLGGNTKTLMIACISPVDIDYMETLSTLRYANRAKNISNKPRVNEDPKDAILREHQKEIERLKMLLTTTTTTTTAAAAAAAVPAKNDAIDLATENGTAENTNFELDAKRDKLLEKYQREMEKLRNLHESEKHEKETILKQIEIIKNEYEANIKTLNEEMKENQRKDPICSNEEIMKRITVLKRALIGGEKANDKELSEKRLKKKMAAEKRASVIAHLLAKIDMDEDRELLQNQYKNISDELQLRTDGLRKLRHKIRALQKEICDIQSEFETERQDYLETIRKQERNVKLLNQINEKLVETLKKDCNYSDLESIKEQSIWLEESQKFKLPEILFTRMKLPPPGRTFDIQTAPARLNNDSSPDSTENRNLEHADSIVTSYFAPTTKRANELLSQSSQLTAHKALNTWREGCVKFPDFAKRNKIKSTEYLNNFDSKLFAGNQWLNHFDPSVNNNTADHLRKPLTLKALPNITKSISTNQTN